MSKNRSWLEEKKSFDFLSLTREGHGRVARLWCLLPVWELGAGSPPSRLRGCHRLLLSLLSSLMVPSCFLPLRSTPHKTNHRLQGKNNLCVCVCYLPSLLFLPHVGSAPRPFLLVWSQKTRSSGCVRQAERWQWRWLHTSVSPVSYLWQRVMLLAATFTHFLAFQWDTSKQECSAVIPCFQFI